MKNTIAMLNIYFDSIAKMEIWTYKQEADNLAAKFEGKNKAKFARENKIRGGASMLSQHVSGNRPISLEAAIAYAKGFGCSLAEISPRLDTEIKRANAIDAIELPPNSYNVNASKQVLVPVVGKAMGGLPDNLFTDEGRIVNGHDEYGEVFSADKNAFITRVDGNSMYPKYHQGGYALVEPNTVPEIEDEVLIKINTGQVMLKKLISRRGGGVVLSSYNETATHTFADDEIVWMYYVAYPVPERKIKHRL